MTQKQPSQTTSVLLFNINLMRERFLTFEVRRMLGLRRLRIHLVSLESVAEDVIRLNNSSQDTCHFQGSTANRLLPVVLVTSLQDNLLRVCRAATFSDEFEPKLTVRSDGAAKIADCIGNPGHLEMNKVIFQLRNGIKLIRMILTCRSSPTIDEGVLMTTSFKLVVMDSRSGGLNALLPLQESRVVPPLPFTCGATEEGVRANRQFLRLLAPRDKKSREIEFQNCPVQRIEFQDLNNARNSGGTTMHRFQGFLHFPDVDVSTEQKSHGLMVSPKELHTFVDEINFSETSPLSAIVHVGFNTDASTVHCKAQVAVAFKEKKKWKGGVMQADDRISLGVHDFKGSWLRAVTLMLQFWQTDSCISRELPTFCRKKKSKKEIICLKNGLSQNSIDINRFVSKSTCYGSQLERDHAVADMQQAKMLNSLKDDAVVINLLQDCHNSRDDSSVCAVNVSEARKRCCGQEVLPGAVQVLHSEAGQSGLFCQRHHQQSKSVNLDEDDFDEEAEDFDDESVLDSLEIEDEDQLDMILQDVQDDLQNANNDLIGNEVPIAAWLPDMGQGYQVFPVPHDEVPEGHGVPQNLLNDVQMEQQAPEGEEDAGENDEVGDNFLQGQHVVNGDVIVPWMQEQNGNQFHDDEVPLGQEPMHNQNAALVVLEIPVNAPQAQGPPENAGPQDEAPQHFPIQQQHLNAVPNVNENGAQNDGQNDVPDADGADEHLAVQAPLPPPPPPHLPPHEEHPPQQVQANRPLNRLRAAARYIKRRFTWNRHGNSHHGNPLYVPGAPREERAPLGLEEAPALPGDQLIQNEVQRMGCFSACFLFLFRRRISAAVQVYPQHSEQAPEFEEVAPMPHEVDEEIVEEEEEADAEPLEAVEEIPPPNNVLIF